MQVHHTVGFPLGLFDDALLLTLALFVMLDSSVQSWAMIGSNTWGNALLHPCVLSTLRSS